MSRTKSFAPRAAVVATLLAASLATATPASAAGPVSGTWGDNPMLCATSSCVKNGNVVRMWQTILHGDDLYDDIDGVFGPNTAAATVKWQKAHGLGNDADGWVGPNTWNKAYSWVTAHHYATVPGEGSHYTWSWNGYESVYFIKASTTGVWEFNSDIDSTWRTATW
ncbi:peptidoglycan-binding protein [Streptomyces sp. NPDC056333]|uniref:peptidoglycan-binding domain-containing protein n=1 Tax=Streptomyces sp. NPDC056333 TaxID=3345786 RepID=UPI0035DBB790